MTALDERPLTGDAELLGVFEPGSPAWHAARAAGIGGSEIAAVLNISPWESPFSLWHRKAGTTPPREANIEMDAGRRLEPVICEVFAERHPEFLVRSAGTYRNIARPYQIANPDRLLYAAGPYDPTSPTELLEAKYSLSDIGWGDAGSSDVPPYYQAQTRWYGDTLGVRRVRMCVFFGSTGEFREYVIDADATDTALMRERAEEFMASLAARRRPPIDGHDATFRVVKAIPDGMDDIDVEVAPHMKDEYFDALDAEAAAKTEKQRAAAVLLDAIGTGHRARCLTDLVATRTVRDGKTYSLQPARNRGNAA